MHTLKIILLAGALGAIAVPANAQDYGRYDNDGYA